MNEYIVLYRLPKIMSDLDAPFGFSCFARNSDDAEQQFILNYPDADIVWVVNTETYQEALHDYYGTSLIA